nr:MarR family transcriptional regulator [Sedimentibacter acidaminivorans]
MPEKEKFIFGSLFLLANRLQVIGDRWDTEITMKQWFLLVMTAHWGEIPPTLSELADFIGSSRQNVKQLALKLEAKGFLKIEKDPKDNRALRIMLTVQCIEYFKKRENRENLFLDEVYKDITDEEKGALYKGLYKLSENIFRLDELSKG